MSNASSEVKPGSLLSSLMSDDAFRPAEPRTLQETGLTAAMLDGLILKLILVNGSCVGRDIAERACIPFGLIEKLLADLRTRQLIVHVGSAALGDYRYTLTDNGRDRARTEMNACAYVGSAPVPLDDYITSVEAQTIRAESPRLPELQEAFKGLSVEPGLFDCLGPAVNSGAGLFLYGQPGNGKTTLAKRITACFGQDIWVPHAIIEDGQIIKFFDAADHEVVKGDESSLLSRTDHDCRWVRIRRPTVVVGGELTMDSLEIRHDYNSNVSEASLQMKSNCGCLLIDDFGRQRMDPTELLNRWIVPLENRYDFLTLATGKKIQVPFEQLIIFSTNLEPADLTDDAFLRRIPYKVEVGDPSEQEFHQLFKIFSRSFDCHYDRDAVDHLINTHYKPFNRPLRRCQPRDLLTQIRNYCVYTGQQMEMLPEHFDRVVKSYFTVVAGD